MRNLQSYISSLNDVRLRALYGADEEYYYGMKYFYEALVKLVEPLQGDLLLITRDDAQVLKNGQVLYSLCDEPKAQDQWRRAGSTFMLDDRYVRRSTLDIYLRYFPMILERDLVVQQYFRMIHHRPGELIVKLQLAA